MKPPKGKPCRACPMRRQSLPGYVGNDTPEHFITMMHSDGAMPCHLAIDYEDPKWREQIAKAPQCSGQAVYLSNTCKSPRPGPNTARTLPADRTEVFSNPQEFLAHHGGREALVQIGMPAPRDLGLHKVIKTLDAAVEGLSRIDYLELLEELSDDLSARIACVKQETEQEETPRRKRASR